MWWNVARGSHHNPPAFVEYPARRDYWETRKGAFTFSPFDPLRFSRIIITFDMRGWGFRFVSRGFQFPGPRLHKQQRRSCGVCVLQFPKMMKRGNPPIINRSEARVVATISLGRIIRKNVGNLLCWERNFRLLKLEVGRKEENGG
jgi:hypothetical protein